MHIAVDPTLTTDDNNINLRIILPGVLLPIALFVLLSVLGATAVTARYYCKKVLDNRNHIYDLPNIYEVPPLPPPRPALAVNKSVTATKSSSTQYAGVGIFTACTMECATETTSLQGEQQANGVSPVVTVATDNCPEYKSEDVQNGAASDLCGQMHQPVLSPVTSCREKTTSLQGKHQADRVSPAHVAVVTTDNCHEPDSKDVLNGAVSESYLSGQAVNCKGVCNSTQGSQQSPSLSLVSNVHESELNSEHHLYEQICGNEEIPTCDVRHIHSTPDHDSLHQPEQSPVTSCKEQNLGPTGDHCQSHAESNSHYERIWGYETIEHCDLSLECLLQRDVENRAN